MRRHRLWSCQRWRWRIFLTRPLVRLRLWPHTAGAAIILSTRRRRIVLRRGELWAPVVPRHHCRRRGRRLLGVALVIGALVPAARRDWLRSTAARAAPIIRRDGGDLRSRVHSRAVSRTVSPSPTPSSTAASLVIRTVAPAALGWLSLRY
jgi:hypothetical protein